jgi:hypothetical protein
MQQTVTCASCGAPNAANQKFCTSCGAALSEQMPQQQQAWQAQQVQPAPATAAPSAPAVGRISAPPRRYVLLSAAAIIFRILGWIVLFGGIIGSIAVAVAAVRGAMPGLVDLLDKGMALVGVSGIPGAGLAVVILISIVGSLLLGLGLLAFADLSNAVTAIDESVR